MSCWMFPGQGSQHQGMGQSLFERFPSLVAGADRVLGYSVRDLCLVAPAARLNDTRYTQAALFVVNALAHAAACEDSPVRPSFLLGHSLGEISALWAAGVFDFETGLRIVQRRGELMSEAVSDCGMSAVLGLSEVQVTRILRSEGFGRLDVANYNSPEQTILAGPSADLDKLAAPVKAAGGRCTRLPVSSAFHSRYMAPARDRFAEFLASLGPFAAPVVPVVSNVTARPHFAGQTKRLLVQQLVSPVRFFDSINYLRQRGATDFQEVGPKRVLTGLVKRITADSPGSTSGVAA